MAFYTNYGMRERPDVDAGANEGHTDVMHHQLRRVSHPQAFTFFFLCLTLKWTLRFNNQKQMATTKREHCTSITARTIFHTEAEIFACIRSEALAFNVFIFLHGLLHVPHTCASSRIMQIFIEIMQRKSKNNRLKSFAFLCVSLRFISSSCQRGRSLNGMRKYLVQISISSEVKH